MLRVKMRIGLLVTILAGRLLAIRDVHRDFHAEAEIDRGRCFPHHREISLKPATCRSCDPPGVALPAHRVPHESTVMIFAIRTSRIGQSASDGLKRAAHFPPRLELRSA